VKNKCACTYTDPNASLEQFNFNLEIALYPNPNKGHFELKAAPNMLIEKITMTDLFGKEVTFELDKQDAQTSAIRLENTSEGVYWLHLSTNMGTVVKMIQVLD
jgi:hypothetical protein